MDNNFSEIIEDRMVPKSWGHEVLLSLILPVRNCSERIGYALESILRQNYPRLEVIVVDAGSTDRTLEIVSSYYPLITRIYSVTEYNIYDMINRGISLASGRYITVLFPESYYISDYALHSFAEAAYLNHYPELIYGGVIQREGKRTPRQVLSEMTETHLSKGISPAPIVACWFRPDIFETIGKFRTDLSLRNLFEYFCRFSKEKDLKSIRLNRFFVDYDAGPFSYKKVIPYAIDTWRILTTHYGLRKAFIWFLGVNHLLLLKWFWKTSKEYLFAK